jgi:hypothetical protein
MRPSPFAMVPENLASYSPPHRRYRQSSWDTWRVSAYLVLLQLLIITFVWSVFVGPRLFGRGNAALPPDELGEVSEEHWQFNVLHQPWASSQAGEVHKQCMEACTGGKGRSEAFTARAGDQGRLRREIEDIIHSISTDPNSGPWQPGQQDSAAASAEDFYNTSGTRPRMVDEAWGPPGSQKAVGVAVPGVEDIHAELAAYESAMLQSMTQDEGVAAARQRKPRAEQLGLQAMDMMDDLGSMAHRISFGNQLANEVQGGERLTMYAKWLYWCTVNNGIGGVSPMHSAIQTDLWCLMRPLMRR